MADIPVYNIYIFSIHAWTRQPSFCRDINKNCSSSKFVHDDEKEKKKKEKKIYAYKYASCLPY